MKRVPEKKSAFVEDLRRISLCSSSAFMKIDVHGEPMRDFPGEFCDLWIEWSESGQSLARA